MAAGLSTWLFSSLNTRKVWGFPQKNPTCLEIVCTVHFHPFYFYVTNKCTIFDADSFLLFITLLHVSMHKYRHQRVTLHSIDTKIIKVRGYQCLRTQSLGLDPREI